METLTEAGARIGRSYATMLRWVACGFLPARRKAFGHGFEVHEADVDRCAALPRKGSPPRQPKRPHLINRRDKNREYMRQYSAAKRKRRQGA